MLSEDKATLTRFGLIRHAETLWNREKRIQGQSDSPLTAQAERQVEHWAKTLEAFSWDRLLCSDLGRARTTALRINALLKLPLTTEPGLREQNWGRWTSKTISEVQNELDDKISKSQPSGWRFRPPGGEQRADVLRRAQRALQEAALRWPGSQILIVTHEGVIKSLIYHLSGRKYLPSEPKLIKDYHLHWLSIDGTGLHLGQVNAQALNKKT
jgi:probable phosphoglycerate mutase